MMPPFVTGDRMDRRLTVDQDRIGVLMSVLGGRLRHAARSWGGSDLMWISNCACNFHSVLRAKAFSSHASHDGWTAAGTFDEQCFSNTMGKALCGAIGRRVLWHLLATSHRLAGGKCLSPGQPAALLPQVPCPRQWRMALLVFEGASLFIHCTPSPPPFVSCSFFCRPTGHGGPSSTSTALRHVG